jgi:hypothetical protein
MPNKYTQPPRENKNAAASPNPPVKTFRLGRIKAAVWENEGEQKFYSVTFARTYVDEANNYHDTDSFGRDDLPLVAKLADQAHTLIFERRAELKTKQSVTLVSASGRSSRPLFLCTPLPCRPDANVNFLRG